MKGPLQDWINKWKKELAQKSVKQTPRQVVYYDETTPHNFTEQQLIEMLKNIPKVNKK